MAYLQHGYKNYSRFYRDHDTFDYLGNHLLFELAKSKVHSEASTVDAWCCGCSGGEEPYTVQMLWATDLAPHFPALQLRLLATDLSASAIATARRAQYTAHAIVEMPFDWLDRYFLPEPTAEGGGAEVPGDAKAPSPSSDASTEPAPSAPAADPPTAPAPDRKARPPRPGAKAALAAARGPSYTVAPQIREAVQFLQQDAEAETPAETFDLILARYSVFLYCNAATAWTILQQMVLKCLRPGGFLVIGGKDNLPVQWSSLPLEKCTGGSGFQHGVNVYRRKPVGVEASPRSPGGIPPSGEPSVHDTAPGPCAGQTGRGHAACRFDTLDEFLTQHLRQPARYTAAKRRLVFQMNDAYSTFEGDKTKLTAGEMEDFVKRMEQATQLMRSKLHQSQAEFLKTEMSEMARYRVPALTAEGIQQFVDKQQQYEERAREKQEKLRKQLFRSETGRRKRKRLSRKRMKKFLTRMAAHAARPSTTGDALPPAPHQKPARRPSSSRPAPAPRVAPSPAPGGAASDRADGGKANGSSCPSEEEEDGSGEESEEDTEDEEEEEGEEEGEENGVANGQCGTDVEDGRLGGLLGRGKDGGEGGPPGEAKPAQTLWRDTEEASEAGCRLRAGQVGTHTAVDTGSPFLTPVPASSPPSHDPPPPLRVAATAPAVMGNPVPAPVPRVGRPGPPAPRGHRATLPPVAARQPPHAPAAARSLEPPVLRQLPFAPAALPTGPPGVVARPLWTRRHSLTATTAWMRPAAEGRLTPAWPPAAPGQPTPLDDRPGRPPRKGSFRPAAHLPPLPLDPTAPHATGRLIRESALPTLMVCGLSLR
eukprot:EG_transcript_2642